MDMYTILLFIDVTNVDQFVSTVYFSTYKLQKHYYTC